MMISEIKKAVDPKKLESELCKIEAQIRKSSILIEFFKSESVSQEIYKKVAGEKLVAGQLRLQKITQTEREKK